MSISLNLFKLNRFCQNVKIYSMSKFRLINLIDTIFISISLFLILFSVLNYFIKSIFYSSIISAIVTFSFLFLLRLYKNYKKEKQSLIPTTEEAENFFINFALLKNSEYVKILKKIFPESSNYVSSKSHINFLVKEEKCCTVIFKTLSTLNLLDAINLIDNLKPNYNKIFIFSFKYDPKIKSVLSGHKDIQIQILSATDTLKLLRKNNIKIDEKIKIKQQKISIKDVFKGFFSRKHSKSFFFGGIIFILTSFIISFKTYYLIFGILFLIFSIISRFNNLSINSNY